MTPKVDSFATINPQHLNTLVSDVEAYLSRFVSFPEPCYTLPLALWLIGTFHHMNFDAFPYLVITSDTKRSGKTRLGELLSFVCSAPRMFGAMTAGGLFRAVDSEHPTLFIDEAETLSSESANNMRAVLNMGYRRGQTIPRVDGNGIKEFSVYCPKVFILIGDVYDTLKDRALIVRLRRAEAPARFTYEAVKTEGNALRERIRTALDDLRERVDDEFVNFPGCDFLTDRDEEIWTPLLVLANIFCPNRVEELNRYAVDLCTEKTQTARRYVNLLGEEKKAEDDEYSKRLLADVFELLQHHRHMSSSDLIDGLKAIDTAPWRKFRGEGITVHSLSDMLSRFGVKPVAVRIGSGRKNSVLRRGYKRADVAKAVSLNGGSN
jgi:hypothetical protein